jgi:hypothetical protein
MTWLISICFAIAAIICAFFRPMWSWAIIALPELFLCWMAFTNWKARSRYREIPGLSPAAQELFRRYPHYYHMPFACSDFGSAAVYLEFAGVALAIVGLFDGFWLGIAIAVPNTVLMGRLAYRFDPRPYVRGHAGRLAHEEIMALAYPNLESQDGSINTDP